MEDRRDKTKTRICKGKIKSLYGSKRKRKTGVEPNYI